MVDPFVPQVDVGFDLFSLGKHRGAHVIHLEDEHPPFLVPIRDDLAFFFDEASEMSEPDLHSLVDDLTD